MRPVYYRPQIKIEVLVPRFRGRMDVALKIMHEALPDVFNHNIETVPRYINRYALVQLFMVLKIITNIKTTHPQVDTKSGSC